MRADCHEHAQAARAQRQPLTYNARVKGPPEFKIFGDDDPSVSDRIQARLPLRGWSGLTGPEKKIILQQLTNNGWVKDSSEIASTIAHLNESYLRLCPGKNLHSTPPHRDYNGQVRNSPEREKAARADFEHILMHEKSEPLVLRMLSILASRYIDQMHFKWAEEASNKELREKYAAEAFGKFDRFANCLNHIFEQFSINWRVTRSGLVPMQDEKITAEIYAPTLLALSDPKWKAVNADLSKMFQDYGDRNYSEAITKAHAAVQRFLQIVAGEEGTNSKGEVGKLFQQAKKNGLIPAGKFSEQFINAVQSAIVAERATNSTAKPAMKEAAATDALLVMNLTMVFFQHCLSE